MAVIGVAGELDLPLAAWFVCGADDLLLDAWFGVDFLVDCDVSSELISPHLVETGDGGSPRLVETGDGVDAAVLGVPAWVVGGVDFRVD